MTERSTLDAVRSSRIVAYTVGAVCLGAGLFLLVWTDRSETIIGRIAGVLLVIIGAGEAIDAVRTHRSGSYWGLLLVRGLLNLGVGVALLVWPNPTIAVLMWLIGLDLVLTGVLGLLVSGRVPADLGRRSIVLRSAVGIVAGLVIMVWPNETVTVLMWLIGLQLILLGLIMLWSGYQLSRSARAEP